MEDLALAFTFGVRRKPDRTLEALRAVVDHLAKAAAELDDVPPEAFKDTEDHLRTKDAIDTAAMLAVMARETHHEAREDRPVG